MDPDNVKVYEHKADLEYSVRLSEIRSSTTQDKGRYLFDPATFKGHDFGNSLDAFRLPEKELIRYAELVTVARKNFRDKAARIGHSRDDPPLPRTV